MRQTQLSLEYVRNKKAEYSFNTNANKTFIM